MAVLARRARAASARRARRARRSPPETSETPTTVAPFSASSVAAMPPTLPNPWTTQRSSVEVPAEPRARALDHHHDAGARRLVPEQRAADRDRLAGHDLGHGVALLHRVGVHHPGHRLLVRGHVRRGDVELRADERREVGGEPARHARELAVRELPRAAAHAALRAAVGQAQQRALPGHPHRERRALAEADVRVVADAALRRPEHRRVLHAVGRERPDGAVVQLDRQRQDHGPLGVAKPLGDRLGDARPARAPARAEPAPAGRAACPIRARARNRRPRPRRGLYDRTPMQGFPATTVCRASPGIPQRHVGSTVSAGKESSVREAGAKFCAADAGGGSRTPTPTRGTRF